VLLIDVGCVRKCDLLYCISRCINKYTIAAAQRGTSSWRKKEDMGWERVIISYSTLLLHHYLTLLHDRTALSSQTLVYLHRATSCSQDPLYARISGYEMRLVPDTYLPLKLVIVVQLTAGPWLQQLEPRGSPFHVTFTGASYHLAVVKHQLHETTPTPN